MHNYKSKRIRTLNSNERNHATHCTWTRMPHVLSTHKSAQALQDNQMFSCKAMNHVLSKHISTPRKMRTIRWRLSWPREHICTKRNNKALYGLKLNYNITNYDIIESVVGTTIRRLLIPLLMKENKLDFHWPHWFAELGTSEKSLQRMKNASIGYALSLSCWNQQFEVSKNLA